MLSIRARAYIGAIIAGATALIAYSATISRIADPSRLGAYMLAALFAAGLKVSLPGITGTMSVSYVFILIGIAELSLGEAVAIAALSTVLQSVWHAKKRPKAIHLIFNAASISLASAGSYFVYHDVHMFGSDKTFRLALASCTYFLLNTMSIAGVVSLTEGKNVIAIWRDCYFWSFPYYLIGASITALIRYLFNYFDWRLTLFILPVVYVIFRSYRLYLGQLEREKEYAEQMAALHLRTIEALALAIETKDHTTGTHLRRVQVYARELAKDLALDENETKALQAASILHDIGKLAVPDYIISKPGRLTPEEFEKMKIHPVVGAEILATINFPYPVVPVVRAHHEKWDGSGYPDGLKGEEIPLGARILSCVDCFDALASDRQYRKALTLEEALKVVKSESGKSFDPAVVDLLEKRYQELEQKAWAEPVEESKKLSVDVKITRGESPDSGFQSDSGPAATEQGQGAFVNSIAAARQEVQSLYELTQSIGTTLSLGDTLSVVAARIKTLAPYDAIAIYILENDLLIPHYVNGENQKLFSALKIPLGEGLSGWVAENRKPILNGNPSVEPGYLHDSTKFSTLRSALGVPLETASGVIGVVGLYKAEKDAFSRDHLRVLLAINSKVSLAIENALRYQQAKIEATTDALTLLPNASSLFMHLEAELSFAAREQTRVAVLVCDLDGFKQVNDRFGHLVGNRVLQVVSRHLREDCHGGEYAARMGGDEFVVTIPNADEKRVQSKINRLAQMVRQVGEEICNEPVLGVSIGAAFYPDHGSDTETLLGESDRRMYSQKAQHKREAGAPPLGSELARLGQSLEASETATKP
ncbi:MAG: diguanylate cyclase [Acidobacteria bacterium]|nr:diguanylate cyclase [Acidobacteriota bacterium]